MTKDKRGFRLMYLWCRYCGAERPFNHLQKVFTVQVCRVRRRPDGPLKCTRILVADASIPSDAVQIRARCMVCLHRMHFVTTAARLGASFVSLENRCGCGLEWLHLGAHLDELSHV